MSKKFLPLLSFCAWLPLLAILTYRHSSPLGNTIKFRHNLTSDQPWAEKMIQNGHGPVVLKNRLSSFLLKVPEGYQTVKIAAKFKNKTNEVFKIAVQTNQGTRKSNIRSLDYQPLNDLPWDSVKENGLILYQKNRNYETLRDFLAHLPTGAVVTFYEVTDLDQLKRKPTVLADYEPSEERQTIGQALRGSHTLYTYLKNEDLDFELEKQDLNQAEGKDVLTIDVSNRESLFTQTVPDDGLTDDSGRVTTIQKVKIKIPGLPEGVYKIVLEQPGGDALIKNLTTPQHKLVFANKIYPVGGGSYQGILPKPVTVYSRGARLTAITREENFTQTLTINDELVFPLTEADQTYSLNLPLGWHKIFIPKNNVQLGDNYFAFSEAAYFEPFDPGLYPYNAQMNQESFDYLLTSYSPPAKEGDWLVNQQTFDTSQLEIVDNLTPVTLIVSEIWKVESDEDRVAIDYLEIEMTKAAPINPRLAQKIIGFFPQLINTARAVEPKKRVSWLRDQFSLKKILSSLFSHQAGAMEID